MNTRELISRFNDVKKVGNEFKCKCPAHNDKNASLTIKEGNDRSLVYCHSGCSIDKVLSSVGLKQQDLFFNALTKREKFYNEESFTEYIKQMEFKGSRVKDVYKYSDENGNTKYFKFRTENKDFNFLRYIDGNLLWGLSEGKYYQYSHKEFAKKERPGSTILEVEETPKVLYNLPGIIKAIEEGRTVFIVEGEKDVNTLWKLGLYATTSPIGGGPGEKKWLDNYSEYFKGADVVILPDNDAAGFEFARLVKRSLLDVGAYKVREWVASSKDKGDVTDWYEGLNNKSEAYELIMKAIEDIKPSCPVWYSVSKSKDKGYSVKLRKNMLATKLNQKLKYVLVKDSALSDGIPHIYDSGVYCEVNGLAKYIKPYIYTDLIGTGTVAEIEKLMLQEKEGILPSQLEGDINIINLKNGLLNVKTGELMPHSEEHLTIKQLVCNYNPNCKNYGYFDSYINDLSEGKEDHKIVLQEMAGLILSNIPGPYIKSCVGLQGKGDTGKGKFFKIMQELIGAKNSASIGIQELTKNFATSVLYGKRFVWDGDLSKDALVDPSLFKKITGGDTISVEFKQKHRMNYEFNGVYAFACNDLPVVVGDLGTHLFNRFTILPCNNVIPKERQNKELVENILKYDSEYVFLWALEGARRLIKNNYNFSYCKAVEDVRLNYRRSSDTVFDFVNETYEITENKKDRITLKAFKETYENWCDDQGITKPVKKTDEFKERLNKIKGVRALKTNGNNFVVGLAKKEFFEEEIEEDHGL